jgi:hypothetical protein
MISPFSQLIDYGVEFQLRKDPSGRLVFLPFGTRGKAYFVDSPSDEEKIRAFVKMYRSASTLVSWMVIGIYIFGLTSMNSHAGAGAIPLRTRLAPLVIGNLVYMLVVIVFAWILWGIYKKTIPSFTASLPEVGAGAQSQLSNLPNARKRVVLICFGAGLLLLGLILLLAVQRRPRRPCPPQPRVCRQVETDSPSHDRPQS